MLYMSDFFKDFEKLSPGNFEKEFPIHTCAVWKRWRTCLLMAANFLREVGSSMQAWLCGGTINGLSSNAIKKSTIFN